MIVVKIELWPLGNEDEKREIGRTYISNVGGTPTRGDYKVRVCRKGQFEYDPRKALEGRGFTRTGEVSNYPRKSYNVWRLILRALQSCFPEEI